MNFRAMSRFGSGRKVPSPRILEQESVVTHLPLQSDPLI